MIEKSLKVEVKPEILKWLLDTSGYKVEDVSKRLSVPKEVVNKWLNGEDTPTLSQIKEMSQQFGRSLAVFLLTKPPEELPLPKDRRSTSGPKPLSPKTYKAIRTARWIQSIAENLMKNLNLDVKPRIKTSSYTEDAKTVAKYERESFGIKVDEQISWKANKTFESWRKLIESKNILVLQIPIPIEEIRGFVLADKEPFIIVVSSSDDPNAKMFTLFHEYAHILLKQSSMCNPVLEIEKSGRDNYEKWCNSFAGSFLLPDDYVNKDFTELGKLTLPAKVSRISNKYKISKHAVLVRLLNLRIIDPRNFNEEVTRLASKKKKKGGCSLPIPEKRIQERGKTFISVVLKNSKENHITNSDVLDYLSIKTKHLEPIRSLVNER
jgi:Zn-dependent peptidase ImmA (M78 family)